MTPETVRKRVERIRKMASDDEGAHSEEDALRHAVLKAIAKGAADPHVLAAEVLKTGEIDFCRWYA